MKIELEIIEAHYIFESLKVTDPHNIYTARIKEKLAAAARAEKEKETEQK